MKIMRTFFLFCFSTFFCFASVQKENIVLIHSYREGNLWTKEQSRGFRQSLGEHYNYHEFFMNTKILPENMFAKFAIKALEFIKEKKPLLVYVTDDNALRLVGRYTDESIPVVFSGINADVRESYPWYFKTNNIAGVLERPLINRVMLLCNKLLQINANRVLILMGTSTTSKAFFQNDLKSKKEYTTQEGLRVEVVQSSNFKVWQEHILASKRLGFDMILVAGTYKINNEEGAHVTVGDIATWVSENSPTPTFTVHDGLIGHDMYIGGGVLSGYYMGEDAANVARSILEYKVMPKHIRPVIQKKVLLKFSESQLDKWGLRIDESLKQNVKLLP